MALPETPALSIARLEAFVYRAPIPRPVRNAFGGMFDRKSVLVRATDEDGTVGWGEVWCNFPIFGAYHRARIVNEMLAGLVAGKSFASPWAVFTELTRRCRLVTLQTGEPGSFAQAVAGVDIALWDLAARKARLPLCRLLGAAEGVSVPAYASGLGPDGAIEQLSAAQERGHRAAKLKIGFGDDTDFANLRALRDHLGPDLPLAVDANQSLDLTKATRMAAMLTEFDVAWFEEPLPADTPWEAWRLLAKAAPMPLAGGENLRGDVAFDAAIEAGAFGVVQPDLAKWGGISGCFPLARRILKGGLRYCPHYLGGGIGLLASAHVLAAAGGDGMLEVDSNVNPLREGLAQPFPKVVDGRFVLPDTPGLGVAPGEEAERYRQSE